MQFKTITIEDSAVPAERRSFDYSCVVEDEARAAAIDAAAQIRGRLVSQVEVIIQIGEVLISAKENLIPHGQFNDWLQLELRMKPRTAQQYMSAARHFATKTATVAHLKPTTIYLLSLEKSEAARNEVLERLEAGEILDDAEVRDLKVKMDESHGGADMAHSSTAVSESAEAVGTPPIKYIITPERVAAYWKLTLFLMIQCGSRFEELVSLLKLADLEELAGFMWAYHSDNLVTERKFCRTKEFDDEPELLKLMQEEPTGPQHQPSFEPEELRVTMDFMQAWLEERGFSPRGISSTAPSPSNTVEPSKRSSAECQGARAGTSSGTSEPLCNEDETGSK